MIRLILYSSDDARNCGSDHDDGKDIYTINGCTPIQ